MTDGLSNECVGLNVRVKTVAGDSYEGAVFAFDCDQGIFVLYEPSDLRNRSNFRVFKTDCLQELTLLDTEPTRLPEPLNADSKLPKINAAKVKENATTAARERAKKMGQDVTIEAQDIFDAMSKTYPCTWDNASIVVLGEVRIEPPYTVDKVQPEPGRSSDTGGKGIESTVERVKKVLQGERSKMKTPAASKK
eukprot:GGOE01036183.1.p1 GENE.GGOE01036183.1~~GGOE01036183.1.p1  ORF type:complete len:210 (-),score=2.50 GGOE01036183.1:190-768(-)